MGILSWPEAERPRERLLAKGAQTLSDAELLAVLLRNGIKGKDAAGLRRTSFVLRQASTCATGASNVPEEGS